MSKYNGSASDFDDDDDFLDIDDATNNLDNDFDDIKIAGDDDDNDFDVEVIDDTPIDDIGLPDDPDAIVVDDTDDEAMNYSRKVKKRIDKLTAAANTERRAREKVERERAEAVQLIQNMRASHQQSQTEMQSLRERLHNGEKVYVNEVVGSLEAQLKNATDKYRTAYETGQTDDLVAANQQIATLTQRIELARQYTPPAVTAAPQGVDDAQIDAVVNRQPAQATTPIDPTVLAWTERNPWFNDEKRAPMRTVAMAIHSKLVEKGMHPQLDAVRYYATIDSEMRKRFPEYRWPDVERKRQSITTNAQGTRTTKGRQVKLSKSQVALASSLGLTPQQYAAEVVKLDKRRS